MEIIQFEPESKKHRNQFIDLPYSLYRNDPNWVPPIRGEVRNLFNRKKHGFYEHGEAQFLLAIRDGKPVGRMVTLAQRNQSDNRFKETGNFYLFEVIHDFEIAQKLLNRCVSWANERKLAKLYGPKGMTPLDGLGMLTKGFDKRPAFGMPYNPPYYPDYLLKFGFKKVVETGSGLIKNDSFQLSTKVLKAAEIIQEKRGFRVLSFKSRKDLRKATLSLGYLYNESLNSSDDSVALTTRDINTMVKGLLWIAQPELIKIIVKNEEPIGFLLTYPDISEGLQAIRGRIFPFGWVRLLREKHHTEWLNINGIGIVEKYRGLAGTALLFSELYRSIKSNQQFKYSEVIQIGFENERIRQELSGMGIDFYKTHAIFELKLD